MPNNLLRKAQIKMFETVMVLVIFFFLLAFGLVFYARYHSFSVTEKINQNFELRAIEIAQSVSFMPELQCSNFDGVREDCVDRLKLEAFRELLNRDEVLRNEYYYDLLGQSRISFKQVYPESSYEIVIYDRPGTGTKSSFNIPILLYDPIEHEYNTGVMTVEVYQK